MTVEKFWAIMFIVGLVLCTVTPTIGVIVVITSAAFFA